MTATVRSQTVADLFVKIYEDNAHGKREVHTVYANTREECEKLLEEMIPKVRAEIKAEKDRLKSQNETAQV